MGEPAQISSACMALLLAAHVTCQSAGADNKSQYSLFNPTPKHLMREMSTDRPDKTETPHTVDAGHFQIEMDFANYTYRDHKGEKVRDWNILPFNLKVGLLNNVDVQLVFDNYIRTRQRDSADDRTKTTEGVGDLTTRLKINVLGNDSGDVALAFMPFVKFPTNSNDLGNDSIEGGLIVPIAFTLPYEIWLGLMTEVDMLRDDDDGGNHADFINTATLGHTIVGELAGYLEFFSAVSSQDGSPWVGTVDTGLTYGLTEDIQLDCGINIGVTNSADDLNPFAGLSWRF